MTEIKTKVLRLSLLLTPIPIFCLVVNNYITILGSDCNDRDLYKFETIDEALANRSIIATYKSKDGKRIFLGRLITYRQDRILFYIPLKYEKHLDARENNGGHRTYSRYHPSKYVKTKSNLTDSIPLIYTVTEINQKVSIYQLDRLFLQNLNFEPTIPFYKKFELKEISCI